MTKEVKDVQEVESKETETKVEDVKTEDVKTESTVEEILGEEKSEPKMVPEAALINYKKDNKKLAKELAELKQQREDGDITKKEELSSLNELADKFKVDKEFLKELTSIIRTEAKTEIDESVNSKLQPLQEKDRQKKQDEVFKETFDKIIEQNPEYKGIVSLETLKSLALDPKNKSKTFSKIIDEAYGHLIPGKKTMEGIKPGEVKNSGGINMEKALSDTKYFESIMADPILKKKYNEELFTRNNL